MPDWTKSMKQTFEYYKVNPATWFDSEKIDTITSSTITRDLSAETLGSASFTSTSEFYEGYIRVYLVTTQDDIVERTVLGTFLVEASEMKYDGKVSSFTADGYTPLIELTEKYPPLGYTVTTSTNCSNIINSILENQMRAPFVRLTDNLTISQNYTAETSETYMTFLSGLLSMLSLELFVDPDGTVRIVPIKATSSLTPSWTYSDDEESILQSSITLSQDLFSVPNVVEVISSTDTNYSSYTATNTNPSSPVSVVNRGREIVHRELNPDTNKALSVYAEELLDEKSTCEYSISYTHGYCPVTIGDCVKINYSRAGFSNIRAKVMSQTISCTTGCQVSEKAVVTVNLRE